MLLETVQKVGKKVGIHFFENIHFEKKLPVTKIEYKIKLAVKRLFLHCPDNNHNLLKRMAFGPIPFCILLLNSRRRPI